MNELSRFQNYGMLFFQAKESYDLACTLLANTKKDKLKHNKSLIVRNKKMTKSDKNNRIFSYNHYNHYINNLVQTKIKSVELLKDKTNRNLGYADTKTKRLIKLDSSLF